MRPDWALSVAAASTLLRVVSALQNFTSIDLLPDLLAFQDDRPPDCPPCFNCLLPAFQCAQFATCNKYNGKCACPPGFGGEDCSQPVCGSLADGKDRLPRPGSEKRCHCKEGWEGINCNVCESHDACNAMMPDGEGGVCYSGGIAVKENYQMCDVTNRKILDQLKEKKPQVTFSCNAEREDCTFQCRVFSHASGYSVTNAALVWAGEVESFYCALDTCHWDNNHEFDSNSTHYACDNIKCQCIPNRMLCGEADSIDISDFLKEEIKGPASFSCLETEGGSTADGCKFEEPAMNDLIKNVFGDESITLDCTFGECLYKTEVPGYQRPVKEVNTPLIAGVIAGSALFVVAVILGVWYLSRRAAQQKYGYIALSMDDSDDENGKLMTDHKPVSLAFENVSYQLNGKQILSGVLGVANPGQLTAIMGASGAGKTTFLDILARKNKRGVVEGDFYVNGEKVSDNEYRSVIGFVDQEDTMLPTLTVHETILTSALLRLPRDMGMAAKEQRVYEVEKQLGILHIRNQVIGSEEGNGRGISGGEKRRVGIACELVTSPSILFLDEPTSGLDAFNAFNVVECLVNLAKNYNRTVIFTIHQPRSNIVALFDHLVLLAKGRMVYSGDLSRCQSYFDGIGYSCPPGFNIADYLVDLTMHASTSNTLLAEDGALLRDENEGLRTGSSSTRAVKSIPSLSNESLENSSIGSPGNSSWRPVGKRRDSVKQKQDRELYTRKKRSDSLTIETPRSDEAPLDGSFRTTQQWLKLSSRRGQVPPQILDDPYLLPPAANGTGTDLDVLLTSYSASSVANEIREEIRVTVSGARTANSASNGSAQGQENGSIVSGSMKGYRRIGFLSQFVILSKRTWTNLYRNPMLMLTHYAIAILLAVLSGYLFYGLSEDIKGFQNRLGLFFFMLALFGFSTLTTLTVFASERLLFVRERANGYYSPITYFAAKVIFDIVPLRLIPPIIMGAVVYPMVGLEPHWPQFLKFILILVLFNLAAAAVCLFIGIIIKDGGVANLVGSLVMLFSLLFAGLLLNREAIPGPARWLQNLSIFHYAFEALLVNEVKLLSLVDHKYGLDIEVPGASILSSFGFVNTALWEDVISLAIFGGTFIILAYVAMHLILVEKR
ncbi:hypothetical protein FGG08_005721 [Glutinoglossum americanum]|uniref:ABC transporter domain-containing protein n=1 Tax=Glutinoglossum americanum TaxID=1670608 RepID=A0A9P8I2R3_9PEZI|nr:hypothetical protein FGG08_005721 [Glutinoglossum americanum]